MLLWFHTLFIYTVVYLSSAHLVKETKVNEGMKEQQGLSGKKVRANLLKSKHRARAAMSAEKQAGVEKQAGADHQAGAGHQVSAEEQAGAGQQVAGEMQELENLGAVEVQGGCGVGMTGADCHLKFPPKHPGPGND